MKCSDENVCGWETEYHSSASSLFSADVIYILGSLLEYDCNGVIAFSKAFQTLVSNL